MFIMCGYDFCRDINSLNPAPLMSNDYTDIKLTNGIFNHWNVTKDVTAPYSSAIPTTWDYLTLMDANFNGNIEAGNTLIDIDTIDGFKIKRRKIGDFDWVTLKYISKDELLPLNFKFSFNDNLAQSNVEYDYAFVPVVNGLEGNYISNNIGTKFNGVFICDIDTIYRFYAGVNYGANERVQKIGVFEPFGKQYPVIVSNGLINYEKGSVSGTVLPTDYLQTKALDRIGMRNEREQLLNFLTNKKAKILKDHNSNYWLMMITSNPSVNYSNDYGQGIATISANWTEIGDANKQIDLYSSGMVSEVN